MNDTRTTLLVAEREEPTRTFLLENLAADGYRAIGAQTEGETLSKLRGETPTLLVLGCLDDDLQSLALLHEVGVLTFVLLIAALYVLSYRLDG